MPKLPGKKSTRKTIEFANIEGVGSFVGVWDHFVSNKKCSIRGCDHVISGQDNRDWKIDGTPGALPWITCGTGSGASIVYDKTEPPGRHTSYAICVCHTDEILNGGNDVEQDG